MLPPKRQNLFPPFATTFDGDPAECSKHLGRARGMLSLMCRSIPPAKSRTETTADGVEIRVTTNPNHVYIKAGDTLFCTSFNDTDLGTQVYKKIGDPITRDGLITEANNPNKLVLPSPTYSARTNYWVDTKEKNTVSWDYVEYLDISYPVGNINRKRKYGKIAIQGIETGLLWGKFLEPLACALIDKDNDNLPVQRIIIVYIDRINYAGVGNKKYIGIYDYLIEIGATELIITQIKPPVEFTEQLSPNYPVLITSLTGFLGDAKRFVVRSKVDRIYYPIDYPQGATIYVNTINIITFNDDFSEIASNDIIYEEKPEVSQGYNYQTSGGTTTLIVPIEYISSYYVDVRGEYISFGVQKTVSEITFVTSAYNANRGEFYFPYQSENAISEQYLIGWSEIDGLKRDMISSSSISSETTKSPTTDGYVIDSQSNDNFTSIHLYLKKQNECIYSNIISSGTSFSETGILPNGDYGQRSNQSTFESTKTINSKNAGELYSTTLSQGGGSDITDYSYTKNILVASISAFDYDSQNNQIDKSFTLISNLKSKYKIIQGEIKNISITKLP